ncbi:MAG TPA: SGNH/GDSL hydrolase family protein, partial [Thermoanaerobaculia bacterium]|nr:SGNH/GDSL hydrolase family protein [Thermoanaerobaculia bacterium]
HESPNGDDDVYAFALYLALGDSISIDVYPAADVERRYRGKASTDKLGAASLLYDNDDKLWPEFRGRDLKSKFPKIEIEDLTADGATTHSLLRQVERVPRGDGPTLVTITAGGNDLLGEIGRPGPSPAPEVFERLRTAVMRLLELRPESVVLIGTVYDPSDGTNRLPGYTRTLDREAQWLSEYNDLVRKFAGSDPRLRLADIHRHFLGHGMTVSERERWYLIESIIEPSARGASEVRRVWLGELGL